MRLFLLIACLTLVLMVGEADADDTNARRAEWVYGNGFYGNVDLSADGEFIAAGSGSEVYFFNKDSSAPRWSYETGTDVKSVTISSNGKYIAAGSLDVYLFSTKSDTPLWNYTIESNYIISVDISADGEYIVAGSSDTKVYLFDKNSGTPLWNYTVGEVISVVISDNGKYIAASSKDGKIYLFDRDSSTPLWIYDDGLELFFSHVSFHISISADGENIVAGMSGNWSCSYYLFNKDSSTPLWSYTLEARLDSEWCPVAISADGEYIAAGSGEIFYLFDKDKSKPVWNYNTTEIMVGTSIVSVAISADGDYFVAGTQGASGLVYLFDKKSDGPLWYHDHRTNKWGDGPSSSYESVVISADGEYLVVGGGEVKFFTREDKILEILSEFFGEWGFISLIVLIILAVLFHFRKDTGTEDAINKLLKIALYGISIITLLVSLPIMLFGPALAGSAWGCLPGLWILLFAILFAVTGSFLGHETHDPAPSYSYKSSIPPSKPIFSDRRETPIFEPENELITIECPGCSAEMEVPKLGAMQNVTCSECGLSGEIEI